MESRKRPEYDDAGNVNGKRSRTPVIPDGEGEDFLVEGFPIKEESVMEVMKLLEEEISCPNINYPSSSNMFPSPSSSFITINGNEESCGPSFSDSSSSVMASIDMGGISISYLMEVGHTEEISGGSTSLTATENEQWVLEEDGECFWPKAEKGSGNEINGCDGVESDDEWLARVLSGTPIEFEE